MLGVLTRSLQRLDTCACTDVLDACLNCFVERDQGFVRLAEASPQHGDKLTHAPRAPPPISYEQLLQMGEENAKMRAQLVGGLAAPTRRAAALLKPPAAGGAATAASTEVPLARAHATKPTDGGARVTRHVHGEASSCSVPINTEVRPQPGNVLLVRHDPVHGAPTSAEAEREPSIDSRASTRSDDDEEEDYVPFEPSLHPDDNLSASDISEHDDLSSAVHLKPIWASALEAQLTNLHADVRSLHSEIGSMHRSIGELEACRRLDRRQERRDEDHAQLLELWVGRLFLLFYIELFLVLLLWVLITEGKDIGHALTTGTCNVRHIQSIFEIIDWFGDLWSCVTNYFSSVGGVIMRVGSTFLLFPLSRICAMPNYVTIFAVLLLNLRLVQHEVTGPTYFQRPWQLWTIVSQLILVLYANRLRRAWQVHHHLAPRVTDVPYLVLFISIALPSIAITILTALQPQAIDNLVALRRLPYLSEVTSLVELREDLVECCSAWLYLD